MDCRLHWVFNSAAIPHAEHASVDSKKKTPLYQELFWQFVFSLLDGNILPILDICIRYMQILEQYCNILSASFMQYVKEKSSNTVVFCTLQ